MRLTSGGITLASGFYLSSAGVASTALDGHSYGLLLALTISGTGLVGSPVGLLMLFTHN